MKIIIKKEKKCWRGKGLPKIKCKVIVMIEVMIITSGDNDSCVISNLNVTRN